MNKTRRNAKGKRDSIINLLLIVFCVLFVVFSTLSIKTIRQRNLEKKKNEQLAEMMRTSMAQSAEPEVHEESDSGEASEATQIESLSVAIDDASSESEPTRSILPKFTELYTLNHEIAGWLKIDAIGVDLPVMYSPDDQIKYLHQDFWGDYAESGTLFLGLPWDEAYNYAIIYGHNMRNGTMFGNLKEYKDVSFGLEHTTFYFDTLYDLQAYQLLSAFYSEAYDADDTEHFRYYYHGGMLDRDSFEAYVDEIMSLSLYDTGITAEWGDKLLVLSTCDYHTKNGRFVVVAKSIDDD